MTLQNRTWTQQNKTNQTVREHKQNSTARSITKQTKMVRNKTEENSPFGNISNFSKLLQTVSYFFLTLFDGFQPILRCFCIVFNYVEHLPKSWQCLELFSTGSELFTVGTVVIRFQPCWVVLELIRAGMNRSSTIFNSTNWFGTVCK